MTSLPPCSALHGPGALSGQAAGERATWQVIVITTVMMVVEIAAGWAFGSMALLADGWHMASHAGALGITAFAYSFARRHAGNPRFTFGTGKVSSLAGFTSAVVLAMVALLMAWESGLRLVHPVSIHYGEALLVAVVGLLVNLASAWLLGGHGHDHDHGHDHHGHEHDHDHEHCEGHQDHNLRAAYLHILADALTSVTAIGALLAGRYLGWAFLDPLMGLAGSALIGWWSWGLLRDTSQVLLDHTPDEALAEEIQRRMRAEGSTVTDLHLWRAGPGQQLLILALAVPPDAPADPEYYKARLRELEHIFHVSVEITRRAA